MLRNLLKSMQRKILMKIDRGLMCFASSKTGGIYRNKPHIHAIHVKLLIRGLIIALTIGGH